MMKKNRVVKLFLPLSILALSAGVFSFASNKNNQKVNAASPYSSEAGTAVTKIDLNPVDSNKIKEYYGDLSSLTDNQRSGKTLLAYLKNIIKTDQKYFSYDTNKETIWMIYKIIDRDWDKSPASQISGYNSSSKIITNYSYEDNPYLHALYVNYRDGNNMTLANEHKELAWGINQEHVWAKSQGFQKESGYGARGDPMHLMAGNARVNQNSHGDRMYGFVDKSKSYNHEDINAYSHLQNNIWGYPLNVSSSTSTIFEPQDCDKGDIARAIFYMATRYHYNTIFTDTEGISTDNPNLTLTQITGAKSSYTSSETNPGQMGILKDLLAWNRLDPPDEFEIRRNNLLFRNYTKNRNPFIDYPEWAEYIWGSVTMASDNRTIINYDSSSTGSANLNLDIINGFKNSSETINVTGVELNKDSLTLQEDESEQLSVIVYPLNATNKNVTWTSSNNAIATVNDGLVTALKAGSTTITVRTSDGGFTDSCLLTVTEKSTSVNKVELNVDSVVLNAGENFQLTATVSPSTAINKNVTWSSDNENIATVDENGLINAISEGEANITVTTVDGGFTDSCYVSITKTAGTVTKTFSDVLTREVVGVTGTTYTDFSDIEGDSKASYSGKCAGGNDSIQIRSKDSNSGIVSKVSYGKVISITLNWNNATDSARQVKIFGKNTPYVRASDLFSGTTQGTQIDRVTYTSSPNTINVDGDYQFIGICSSDGALYLNSITITYEVPIVSIEITQLPNKTDYLVGEALDLTGLEVTGTCKNGVTFNANNICDYSPEYLSELTVDDEYVAITLGGLETGFDITVSYIPVTGISLNTNALNLIVGDSQALVATLTPNDATNKEVNWSSNNDGIASVDENGIVTANGVGNATITVTSYDSGLSASCLVSVTGSPDPEVDGDINLTKVTDTSQITDGTYIIACEDSSKIFDGSLSKLDAVSNTIGLTATGGVCTLSDLDFASVFYIDEDEGAYSIQSSSGRYIGRSEDSNGMDEDPNNRLWNTITIGSDGNAVIVGTGGAYLRYNATSGQERFRFYKSATYTSQKAIQLYKLDVSEFGEIFMHSLSCDSSGNTAPEINDGRSWESLETLFNLMSSGYQQVYRDAEANQGGTVIERIVARYDYIVKKYHYKNFMSRGSLTSTNDNLLINDDNTSIAIIIVVSSLSILTVALFWMSKKKQYK